jgi:YVTN family beta-propeller protein
MRTPIARALRTAAAGGAVTLLGLAGAAGPASATPRATGTAAGPPGAATGSAAGVSAPVSGAQPVTAYVANLGSGTVTPIRTATNTAGPPIPVGGLPESIAITP